MDLLRRYINFHINGVALFYSSILVRLDKDLFATLFNLRSYLISSPSRLRWEGEAFIVTDKELQGFQYKIRHQKQCDMAYRFGVRRRAASLGACYFLDQIKFNDGDIFLDCGANVGDLKIWVDSQDVSIEYLAFEPSPVEYRCLKENVAPSVAHNIGLWNETGELEFFVSSQGADSSLIRPASFDDQIKVKVERLDKYVNGPIKLLKLEAEGAEPEILQGLGAKLMQIEYISADLGYERGIDCESTLVPVTNLLLQRGFEMIEVSHGRICALYKNKRA